MTASPVVRRIGSSAPLVKASHAENVGRRQKTKTSQDDAVETRAAGGLERH